MSKENIIPAAAGATFAGLLAFGALHFTSDEPPKPNLQLPVTIMGLHNSIDRDGSYVNNDVWQEDFDTPAYIDFRQCPEQNPQLTECVKSSLQSTDEIIAKLALYQQVVIPDLSSNS